MSSCRGIVVAGVTNRARTLIAEVLLSHLISNATFVTSGGARMDAPTMHPLARRALEEWGLDVSMATPSTLAHVRRGPLFDVFISIVDPVAEPSGHSDIMPTTPSHWSVLSDAADFRKKYDLWSPTESAVANERSTRKYQDGYAGEPLFYRAVSDNVRHRAAVRQEQWGVTGITTRLPMESTDQHFERVRDARGILLQKSVTLLRALEVHYGETLISNEPLLARMNA